AKSFVAEGLICDYLQKRVNSEAKSGPPRRRPHLVTFEDPIEHPFFEGLVEEDLHKAVDYTPRFRGEDVKELADGFRDAKRQTPAVVYVGEVRDRAALREVLEFAGSGHLVVTTAHAGTLAEALQLLFAAVEARTPADRGRYAQ